MPFNVDAKMPCKAIEAGGLLRLLGEILPVCHNSSMQQVDDSDTHAHFGQLYAMAL